MSRQYDHYERTTRRSAPAPRSGLGYWVPLLITVSVATVGLAAWIWSERDDDDEDYDGPDRWRRDDRRDDGSIRTAPPVYGDLRQGEAAYGTTTSRPDENPNLAARMSGALRRTPSPQQFFEGASRAVGASVAAAGAVVGNALSSIREEDKNAYKDHKTWSEEAESRRPGDSRAPDTSAPPSHAQKIPFNGKRQTVAVVVSADVNLDGVMDDDDVLQESIMSHLPSKTDFSRIRLFVLIYAPGLKVHPLDTSSSHVPGSLSSSFSNIGHEDAEKPLATSTASPAFNMLWAQAQSLVEKETMILPFSTPNGHTHILRHLGPDIVYLQESMGGKNGDVITQLQSWLRHDVILVVGGEGGSGGLVDSDSEVDQAEKVEQWWQREDRVGRGRGIVVIEELRVGDDWARRVAGRE